MPVPTEINDLSSTAASNYPAGSENVFPSLDNYLRGIQQAIRKDWEWSNPTITSGGTSTAITLTYSNGPSAYRQGQRFSFIAGTDGDASATGNVNALGAKNIKTPAGDAIPNSAWKSGQVVSLVYDGTNLVLESVHELSTTYTPTDASGAGLSLTVSYATYVKIGKIVAAFFHITYPTTASGNTAEIGGLPFNAVDGLAVGAAGGGLVTFTNQGNALTLPIRHASNSFLISNAATGTFLTNANMSGKQIRGIIIYRTA